MILRASQGERVKITAFFCPVEAGLQTRACNKSILWAIDTREGTFLVFVGVGNRPMCWLDLSFVTLASVNKNVVSSVRHSCLLGCCVCNFRSFLIFGKPRFPCSSPGLCKDLVNSWAEPPQCQTLFHPKELYAYDRPGAKNLIADLGSFKKNRQSYAQNSEILLEKKMNKA